MTIDDRRLDAMLRDWATAPAGDAAATARIIEGAGRTINHQQGRRWFAGGLGAAGLAAGVAAALLLGGPTVAPVKPTPMMNTADAAEASFAALYTPTSDEEQFL